MILLYLELLGSDPRQHHQATQKDLDRFQIEAVPELDALLFPCSHFHDANSDGLRTTTLANKVNFCRSDFLNVHCS